METVPPPTPHSPDFAVRELEAARPKLRPELRFRPDTGLAPGFLLEDPLHGKFFRLGEREYRFARSLDGSRTLGEIVASFANPNSEQGQAGAFHEGEAVSLFRSLVDSGLIEAADADHAARVERDLTKGTDSTRLLGLTGSLLCWRLPLGNPDAFFSWLARHAGWLTGRWFFLLWLVLIPSAAWAVTDQWHRFVSETSGVFQVGNLWPLIPAALLLKAWHELWHGLFCRRHGGEVPEIGVAFLLLVTPLGYVNATSSLRFPSRWARIQVAAAGIYGEAFLAALAALCWAQMAPGTLTSAVLHQVMLVSGVTTLLFNANPLMRFDGYYIVSDLAGQPNLATRGQQMVTWLLQRWVLGHRDVASPLWPGENFWLVTGYGLAAAAWRLMVLAGLLVTATHLFHGAGLLLALLVGGTHGLTQGRALSRQFATARAHGSSPWKIAGRLAVIGLACTALVFLSGWESSISAPAVVRSTSGGEVRADCPGFLASVAVHPGQTVSAGAPLILLENHEQTARLRQAALDVSRSLLRRDAFLAGNNAGAHRAECETLAALERRLTELRTHVETLTLRAPRDGVVVGEHLADLQGTWIQSGQLLLEVADPREREILILAEPGDAPAFRTALAEQRPALFESAGRAGSHPIGIKQVAPEATLQPGHASLMTAFQGPLAVRRVHEDRGGGIAGHELVEPRVMVRGSLGPGPENFLEGERGRVTLPSGRRQALADRIAALVRDWLERTRPAT
ncbi:MAG: putative peptide zinc metalloprotease protein [Verrucomicrobia bacterium]|jgi:putative peptide zinc metalloprotease protein|nr:MAG: putative peptide zinc metalloprotease protein [Verrucomicrobiota bacterium]